MKWTNEEIAFLTKHYPEKGRAWCAKKLNRPLASIRQKTYNLGLKQNQSSAFFNDWQKRAATSKIGKRRPEQAKVLLELHTLGKLKMTEQGKKIISEKTKERLKEVGHPRGMLGKKHSDENKEKFSEFLKKGCKL